MSEQSASTFVLRYSVSVPIRSDPEAVWARLTDAAGHPAWNSTVEQIDGDIFEGSRLAIRVPIAPGRTFRPTVTELDAPRSMTWRDGRMPMFRGTRTFTLTATDPETTQFSMTEEFRGLMLPLVRRSLPDFGPVFDRYAEDLRRACETAAA
jgi:hypothetical protein